MAIENSQGKILYGIHFYPGVAEYAEPGKEPHRVFLNENTLRQMDPTFAGKPVFVQHVDEVESSIDKLRSEADGWVIESFFNEKDGKHWVKFIVVSELGLRAIDKGMRLSNAYLPKQSKSGGLWNGVEYQQEITAGEYEHLAIVQNPRYEESVIMTPEEFKLYNTEKEFELKKLANSKDQPKGETKMAFEFFKKAKIENTLDVENTLVKLPKSKKEVTLLEAITSADVLHNMAGYASDDHMAKMDNGSEMSVKEMKECINKMHKDAISEEGGEPGKGADDEAMNSEESVSEDIKAVDGRGGDKSLENKEDEDKKEEKEAAEKKKNEIKAKAKSLKNAGAHQELEIAQVYMTTDKLAVGKARYGSN